MWNYVELFKTGWADWHTVLNIWSHLADQQRSWSAQPSRADSSFNIPVILFDELSLVFDSVGVAVFIAYHFVLFCRPGTQNSSLFLNTKPNLNSTKNCLSTPHLRLSSISRGQFRAGLKTHLFTQAYGHLWELLLKSVLFYIYMRWIWMSENCRISTTFKFELRHTPNANVGFDVPLDT